METLFWITFFLTMANALISAYVMNQVIKDRKAMDLFVNASRLYSEAFNRIASKNVEIIDMVNNHTDIIEQIKGAVPVPAPQEATAKARKRARIQKPADTNSTVPE